MTLLNPKVSVVMSVKDGDQFLTEAIDSILNQLYTDFEFIIINDGSRDKTSHILESYHDRRIRVITHLTSKGLTLSLNEGISSAKGAYIARMDADDISEPYRLKDHCQLLDEDHQLILVGCWFKIIDEQGSVLDKVVKTGNRFVVMKHLIETNQFVHGSVMFRKSEFLKVGGYRSFFLYSQDYDLWLRLISRGHFSILQKYGYRWRLRASGISIEKRALQQKYSTQAQLSYFHRLNHESDNLDPVLMKVSALEVGKAYAQWSMSYIYFGSYKLACLMALKSIKTSPMLISGWKSLFISLGFGVLPESWRLWVKKIWRKFFIRILVPLFDAQSR